MKVTIEQKDLNKIVDGMRTLCDIISKISNHVIEEQDQKPKMDAELRQLINEEPKTKKQEKHRKQRSDAGAQRNNGDFTTVFFSPEITKLLDLPDSRYVNGKIKAFNKLGEGKIQMPGAPYHGGYKADEATWDKFFIIYSK